MKRSSLWVIRLSLALSFAGYLMADDASDVLKSVANTYQNLRGYYFEGSTLSETKMGNNDSKSETKFVVAFESPNRFRVEYIYPTAGNWIRVSNGTNTWKERSISKDFSKAAAVPEDAPMMIVFRDRRAGESKMDGAIVVEAVFQLPRLRFGSHHVERAERPLEEPTVEEA